MIQFIEASFEACASPKEPAKNEPTSKQATLCSQGLREAIQQTEASQEAARRLGRDGTKMRASKAVASETKARKAELKTKSETKAEQRETAEQATKAKAFIEEVK